MHQSSYEKMQDFRNRFLSGREAEALSILDVGAMDVNGSYRALFDGPRWAYRGADLEAGRNVDLVLDDPYHFSDIASGSVDVVVSGQALEHMPRFWLFFLEVFRCLKPGGLCCVIAPAGGYEHRYPVDCWRFYPDGMRSVAEFARLEVLEAFTDWTPAAHYRDDSAVWQDSVLIARKPSMPAWRALRLGVRNRLLRLLTR